MSFGSSSSSSSSSQASSQTSAFSSPSSSPVQSFFQLRQDHGPVCARCYSTVTGNFNESAMGSTLRRVQQHQARASAAAAAARCCATLMNNITTSRRNRSTSLRNRQSDKNNHEIQNHHREWHDPSFMSTSSCTEKEQWLESMLQQQKQDLMKQQQYQQEQPTDDLPRSSISDYYAAAIEIDISREATLSSTPTIKPNAASSPSGTSSSTDTTSLVDAEAFLVVLKSLTGTTDTSSSSSRNNNDKSSPSNPRRAEYWMKRMNDYGIQPTPECYQCVIEAWANSSNNEEPLVVVNRSERWLNEMSDPLSSFSSGRPGSGNGSSDDDDDDDDDTSTRRRRRRPMPTIGCYNAFLDACTRGRQMKSKHSKQILVDNSLKAESILRKLVSLSFHHMVLPATLHPTTTTFNYVIRGISRCKDDETIADRILALVRMMEGFQKLHVQQHQQQQHRRHRFDPPCPDTKTYAMAMDALISVGRMKARDHHKRTMKYGGYNNPSSNNNSSSAQHVDFDGPEYDGDYDFYTNDVDEHGNEIKISDDDNAGSNNHNNGLKEMEDAAAILQYMHDLYDAEIPNVVPNRVPYNILITGWAGLASFGVGGSASKKVKRSSSSRSSSSYNNITNEFGNEMESSQEYDAVTWYCNSAPFKAEEILRTMMSHGDEYNNSTGTSIFGGVFGGDPSPMDGQDSNGKTPRLGFRNRKCPDAKPDRISYEKVILAWGNSGHPNAGKRALWWLKQLWSETENAEMSMTDNTEHGSQSFSTRVEELCPTVSTYNAVMKALVSSPDSGGALAAENLLLDLGEKYRSLSSSSTSEELKRRYGRLRPNSESFAIVIRAWLRESYDAYGADNKVACVIRAVEWLTSLHDVENENDLSTTPELFTGVLKAANRCARDRPDIIGIAIEVFDTFRDSRFQYDGQCYSTMLQVGLQSYSGPGREQDLGEFVNKLVEECCEDGLLNNVFVRTIANHHSYECRAVTQKYFQHWPLAPSWSRNVKNQHSVPVPRDLRPYNEHPNIQRRSHNLRRRQQKTRL